MSGWLPVSLAAVAKIGCRYIFTILQVMPHSLQGGAEVFSQNNIETLLVPLIHSTITDYQKDEIFFTIREIFILF